MFSSWSLNKWFILFGKFYQWLSDFGHVLTESSIEVTEPKLALLVLLLGSLGSSISKWHRLFRGP